MANESNHIHSNGRNLLDDYLIFNYQRRNIHISKMYHLSHLNNLNDAILVFQVISVFPECSKVCSCNDDGQS